jgi:hypothetical protein
MHDRASPEARSRQWSEHPTACYFLPGNASNGHRCYDLIMAPIITITALLGSTYVSLLTVMPILLQKPVSFHQAFVEKGKFLTHRTYEEYATRNTLSDHASEVSHDGCDSD